MHSTDNFIHLQISTCNRLKRDTPFKLDLGRFVRQSPITKALVNEDTSLRTHMHCCSWCFLGAQTRGTQNECCVSMLRKLGNICCGHKMFLNKIRNIFCVPDTKFVSQQMLRAGANGETFVSATMCPQQCFLFCQGLKANPGLARILIWVL